MLRLLLLFLLAAMSISCQVIKEELPEDPTAPDTEERQGHIAVIRPDYSLWKMVKVLKNMFESRTEKRRQRDYVLRDDQLAEGAVPPLRARRLLFNF